MRLIFSILLVLVINLGNVRAQTQREIREQVEEYIRQFHLQKAQLTAVKIEDPALMGYYQSRILFLKYLSSDSEVFLDPFFNMCKVAMQNAGKLSDKDPLKGVYLAELHFMRGAIRALDNSIVKASFDLNTACNILEANRNRFPDNPEQKKLLGVFNVALGSVPRKFQWLTGIFCFKGDLESGIKMLQESAQSSSLMPEESEVILFFFEKNMLSKPDQAAQRIQKLLDKHPKSFPFAYLQVSGFMELRQTDKALKAFQARDAQFRADPDLFFSPFWDYTRAKMHYFRLELKEADTYFSKFLKVYRGSKLLADAHFRKGMTLALQDDYEGARKIFRDLIENPSSGFDEDDYAWHMSNLFAGRRPTAVELDLFRARNLFDGGYFVRAKSYLEKVEKQASSLNNEDKAELFYRKGRVLQESGDRAGAIAAYKKAFKEFPERNLWMKVYAHYYLGKIYQEQNEMDKAELLFRAALEYDGYFYQSGLEQKCKTALRQLESGK